jgi:hypothetical protein
MYRWLTGEGYTKTPASNVAVLFEVGDGAIAIGSSDGDMLSVGLDDDGFEVVSLAEVSWDVEGFAVGICVGCIVEDVGFRVVGLGDVGFRVVGLGDVGFRVVGLLDVGLAEVGLAEIGLLDGLGVVGMLSMTDIEFLGHTILLESNTVPGDRSTNQEMSNTPELFALITGSIQLISWNSIYWR